MAGPQAGLSRYELHGSEGVAKTGSLPGAADPAFWTPSATHSQRPRERLKIPANILRVVFEQDANVNA